MSIYLIYERCLDTKKHRNIYYIAKCDGDNHNINILRLSNGILFFYSIANGYFPSYEYLVDNYSIINTDSVRKLYQYWTHEPYFDFQYYNRKSLVHRGHLYRNLIPENHLSIFVNMIERDLLGVLEGFYNGKCLEHKDLGNFEKILKAFNCSSSKDMED